MRVTRTIATTLLATAAGIVILTGCGADKYASDPAFVRVDSLNSCSDLNDTLVQARWWRDNKNDPSRGIAWVNHTMDRMDKVHCAIRPH